MPDPMPVVTRPAYRRGDLFDKRRQLMDAWARYVSGAEVVSFPAVRQSA
jgi:hypothetical protein